MAERRRSLDQYQSTLTSMWNEMVRLVGIHTVIVLFDRALWDASQKYPELALIGHSEDGISLDAAEKAFAAKPEDEVSAAFGELFSQLLVVLTRLLGKEIAYRLARELEVKGAAQQEGKKGRKK